MARTALVTGGSRGIGAAISKALKDAGYPVAATYAGNDEAATSFTEETGIKTYKWNVGSDEDSAAGIAKVEEELGPIDIVVANAGITRDAISLMTDWAGPDGVPVPMRIFDTAGMRKKAKVQAKPEKLSVSDGLRAVNLAEVLALLAGARRSVRDEERCSR